MFTWAAGPILKPDSKSIRLCLTPFGPPDLVPGKLSRSWLLQSSLPTPSHPRTGGTKIRKLTSIAVSKMGEIQNREGYLTGTPINEPDGTSIIANLRKSTYPWSPIELTGAVDLDLLRSFFPLLLSNDAQHNPLKLPVDPKSKKDLESQRWATNQLWSTLEHRLET